MDQSRLAPSYVENACHKVDLHKLLSEVTTVQEMGSRFLFVTCRCGILSLVWVNHSILLAANGTGGERPTEGFFNASPLFDCFARPIVAILRVFLRP